jgi:heme/copper-type cytochrome/quinol oxidase subunit 2
MDFKLLFAGSAFLIVGLLMYFNVKSRKAASEETNWEGQLLPQYVSFWCTTILVIIVGIVFILKSL